MKRYFAINFRRY